MSQSSHIDEIYKSRKTIVSLLKRQGYDINNYNEFSIHEVHTMFQTKQLDMLFKKEDGSKKAYVKYHLAKSLRPVNIYEYVDDLFNLEEVLKKSDDLIIIMKDEPNETIQKTLKNIWEQDGIFITIFNIKRLQFNILNHTLVPPHYVLSDEDAKNIKLKYNILSDEQIPDISRFSPVAQAIGLRPGQLCHIVRPSKIAVTSDFYRICLS
jgi:DNA-directed RNA polymerase subunit H (RpoH/RPB5)